MYFRVPLRACDTLGLIAVGMCRFRNNLTPSQDAVFSTMETPLDVLSRAASLIEIDAAKGRSNILCLAYLIRCVLSC